MSQKKYSKEENGCREYTFSWRLTVGSQMQKEEGCVDSISRN